MYHTEQRPHHIQSTNVFRDTERLYKIRHIDKNVSQTAMRKQLKLVNQQAIDNAWNEVIDLTNIDINNYDNIQQHNIDVTTINNQYINATIQATAKLYSFNNHPDFYVLSKALNTQQQLYWCYKCITQYSTANHNNLTNLHKGQYDTSELWSDAVNSHNFSEFHKLRWSSLGYHYDWTQRLYTRDNKDDVFDNELAELCSSAALFCNQDLTAEAAIVNYYVCDGSMGGHVDDAELTDLKPIVSISLGCDCIFLLGGRTKDIKPTAFRLRSGDIAVMSGQSRLCYHGVPRIISNTFDIDQYNNQFNHNQTLNINDNEYNCFIDYMKNARLNINVRQVIDEQYNFDNTIKQPHQVIYK